VLREGGAAIEREHEGGGSGGEHEAVIDPVVVDARDVAADVQRQLRAAADRVAAIPPVVAQRVGGVSPHAPREPRRRRRVVPERRRRDAPTRPARLRAVLARGRARVRAVAHLRVRRRPAEARHPPVGRQPGGRALVLVEELVRRLDERIPLRREPSALAVGGAVRGRKLEHEVAEGAEVARRVVARVVAPPAAPARAELEHAQRLAVGRS